MTLAPTFGKTLVSALFDDAVVEGHVKRAKTPMVAKRGVDLLASVCQWAERKKFRPRYKFQLNRFPTISARLRNSHAGLFALRTGVLPLSGRLVDFRGPVAGHLSSSLTGRYEVVDRPLKPLQFNDAIRFSRGVELGRGAPGARASL